MKKKIVLAMLCLVSSVMLIDNISQAGDEVKSQPEKSKISPLKKNWILTGDVLEGESWRRTFAIKVQIISNEKNIRE